MPRTNAENLEYYQTWRDNIVNALQTPETVSAYGGMPDTAGSIGETVGRMPGRAQLLSELMWVEERLEELQLLADGAFEVVSEMTS